MSATLQLKSSVGCKSGAVPNSEPWLRKTLTVFATDAILANVTNSDARLIFTLASSTPDMLVSGSQ
eukprot:5009673-Amphidinium_carterae.2